MAAQVVTTSTDVVGELLGVANGDELPPVKTNGDKGHVPPGEVSDVEKEKVEPATVASEIA